jgi:uncharacterized protein
MTLFVGAGLIVVVAALVQGTIGLGLSLVAVPAVALLDPSLVPGGTLILGLALPCLSLAHEWRHVGWHDAGWLTGARALTTPLGVLLITWVPASAIGVLVGSGVLLAVLVTAWRIEVRVSRRNLAIAGAVAGVSGTAAGIAGPPAAVVLQDQPGPRLRATLAAFFAIGSLMSLTGLYVAGELTRHQVAYGIGWIPALALGFAIAVPLQRRLQGPRLRAAVLVLSGVSAVAVIVRSLV